MIIKESIESGKYDIRISNSELDMLDTILESASAGNELSQIQRFFCLMMRKQIGVKYIKEDKNS